MQGLKRLSVICFAVLLVFGMVWLFCDEPEILAGSVQTGNGIVLDRAMSDGLPYISVEFEDGTSVLCWELEEGAIADGITVGDLVEITYGVQSWHKRNVVLEVTLMTKG